jgi:hypothetical protein
MCTAGLEFESGRVPLVKAWNNRDFTRSPEPIKYAFRRVRFPRIQKKIKILAFKKQKTLNVMSYASILNL